MKLKMILTGALFAGFVLPAAAQAQTYYVVHDATTKHCTIVDQKPVTTETTTVDANGVVYKTRTEAETAMKTIKVCTTD
jgi:hypothetical protein